MYEVRKLDFIGNKNKTRKEIKEILDTIFQIYIKYDISLLRNFNYYDLTRLKIKNHYFDLKIFYNKKRRTEKQKTEDIIIQYVDNQYSSHFSKNSRIRLNRESTNLEVFNFFENFIKNKERWDDITYRIKEDYSDYGDIDVVPSYPNNRIMISGECLSILGIEKIWYYFTDGKLIENIKDNLKREVQTYEDYNNLFMKYKNISEVGEKLYNIVHWYFFNYERQKRINYIMNKISI